MAKTWKCVYCDELVTELGAHVKISSSKYAHKGCYDEVAARDIIANYINEQREQAALKARKAEDDKREAEAAKLADLLKIRSRGKDLWTADDRKKLAEASLICVHCGKLIKTRAMPASLPGEAASGENQKHCRDCYYTSQYGEQQAAAAATKSQQGLDKVSSVLSGAGGGTAPANPPADPAPKPAPEPKDRFGVIEID